MFEVCKWGSKLRVIAGKAKGIGLDAPIGLNTRPTLDKVREAIYGSLQFEIPGSKCLDLFSGSGAMGIEALSRGAAECIFVDNEKNCINAIKANLARTKLSGTVKFVSFEQALNSFNTEFDFIFMDPPYASGYYDKAAQIVLEKNLLNSDGKIIAEHDGSLENLKGFTAIKTKKYGKAYVTWFVKENV